MPNVGKLLALVALAAAASYGREVLAAAQFVGRTAEVLMSFL